jgi:hypothetical protein
LSSVSDHYQPLGDDDLINMLRQFINEIHGYLQGLGYSENQYSICGLDLIDIIIRVDKRLAYFDYFHHMKINDSKKAALYAYWIIKLRPVKIVDGRLKNRTGHAKVNEKLALNHLLGVLVARGRIKLGDGKDEVVLDIQNKFLKELYYSFRFRNFTIDSMIVLADAINTQSFL